MHTLMERSLDTNRPYLEDPRMNLGEAGKLKMNTMIMNSSCIQQLRLMAINLAGKSNALAKLALTKPSS